MSRRQRLLVVCVLLLGSGGVAHAQLISPGPLHSAHEDLDGDSFCGSCHSQGKQVSGPKCLDCHDALKQRIDSGQGLHGLSYAGKACDSCHIEHLGKKSRLVRWPGGKMEKLHHTETGWALQGSHARVKCLKCHDRKTPGGRTTFLGLPRACASCHKDPHQGRFGAECTNCHTLEKWKDADPAKIDHSITRFPLRGKHQKVECKGCHGEPARWTGILFDACTSCHKDPHQGKFKQRCESCHRETGWGDGVDSMMRKQHPGLSLRNGHSRVKCEECHDRGNEKPPSKGKLCNGCHQPVHIAKFGTRCEKCHKSIKWVGLPEKTGRENHDKTRYPLEGGHARVDCEKCHSQKLPQKKRYRGLERDRCGGCHKDEHAGEFAARDGGECSACHTVQGYAPTLFGVAAHQSTAMPLTGRHQGVACGSCHTQKQPRLDWRVQKQACADCHQNPHGEQFAAEMQRGGCAECHATDGWKQPKFDHSTWPLTGRHAQAACARCHGEVGGGGKAGKREIENAAYRGIPRDCDGCHEDVHAGQFRLNDPVKACDTCHDTAAFTIADFPHQAETGYPLEGKHAGVKCAGCHPTEQLRSGERAVRYRLGYRRCKDCHANPHTEEGAR